MNRRIQSLMFQLVGVMVSIALFRIDLTAALRTKHRPDATSEEICNFQWKDCSTPNGPPMSLDEVSQLGQNDRGRAGEKGGFKRTLFLVSYNETISVRE